MRRLERRAKRSGEKLGGLENRQATRERDQWTFAGRRLLKLSKMSLKWRKFPDHAMNAIERRYLEHITSLAVTEMLTSLRNNAMLPLQLTASSKHVLSAKKPI